MEESKKDKDVHRLAQLDVRSEDYPKGGFMVHHNPKSPLVVEVKSKKHLDPLLMELKKSVIKKFNDYSTRGNGFLRYQSRLCVSNVDDLRGKVLEEDHGS